MEKEIIWKPVRGKEEWAEISNYGQIHRFRRVIYSGRNHQSKRIQEESWTYGSETPDGYLRATIGNVHKGVHVWVYETFYNCDIPKGMEVNHLDEDKHNNCVWNLNLMTKKENIRWGTGIERSAASRRGRKRPAEAVARMAAANRGKKRSEETKKKISDAKRGKPNPKLAAALKTSEKAKIARTKAAASRSKPVQALDPKTLEVVMEFPSTQEAGRQGFDQGNISKCCLGKLKTHKGYIWRYAEK